MCKYCEGDEQRHQDTFEVYLPGSAYEQTMYACCEKKLREKIREEYQSKRVPNGTCIINKGL